MSDFVRCVSDLPLLLTAGDLARLLRRRPSYIATMRREGMLPEPIRLAGRGQPLWERDKLLAFLGLSGKEGSRGQ